MTLLVVSLSKRLPIEIRKKDSRLLPNENRSEYGNDRLHFEK